MSEAPTASAANGSLEPAPTPLLFRDVVGWYAIAILAIGRETGMLDAAINGPVTARSLASACNVDARNADAWLGAMTAHGYLAHLDGTYTMPQFEAASFRGEAVPFDLGAIIDCCHRLPGTMAAVAGAVRTGSGVDPSVYHESLGDAVGRVNAPLYRLLLGRWLEQAGVEQDLQRGVDVADIGCGLGNALLDLAGRYPASQFTGYDVNSVALGRATAEARERGLTNIRFQAAEANSVSGSWDIVLVLDAFHHFPHPETFLECIGGCLKPGGVLLFVEAAATGNVDVDASSPFARILFSANLLICLQEALHDGGAGTGALAGEKRIISLLNAGGFANVNTYETGVGYTIFAARR